MKRGSVGEEAGEGETHSTTSRFIVKQYESSHPPLHHLCIPFILPILYPYLSTPTSPTIPLPPFPPPTITHPPLQPPYQQVEDIDTYIKRESKEKNYTQKNVNTLDICVCIYMCVYVCVCVCRCAGASVGMCMCVQKCVCEFARVSGCLCMYSRACVYVGPRVCVCRSVYLVACVGMYVCVFIVYLC